MKDRELNRRYPGGLPGYSGGPYHVYSELFDRTPTWIEVEDILKPLDRVNTVLLLSRINTHIRHTFQEPTRENIAWLQGFLLRNFLDDDAFRRMQERFGSERLEDRPLFHPVQILNALRVALCVCGDAPNRRPDQNEDDRYQLGTACLMISDLLSTERETQQIMQGNDDERTTNLMVQMLSPFEVVNPAKPSHLLFRSYVQLRMLLKDDAVREDIKRECRGFELASRYQEVTGISLDKWMALLFAAYTYFLGRSREDLVSRPELFIIDRASFISISQATKEEMDLFLSTVSCSLGDLTDAVRTASSSDPRFDLVPFRAKPLFEVSTGNFACIDPAFLLEKMHAGVFWLIRDKLPQGKRSDLFKAWGKLFEHYVDWLFRGMSKRPTAFFSFPRWASGKESFDGVFWKECLIIPMEYKGGFLLREAKYAGTSSALLPELDRKVVAGCKQLASKIGQLFNREPARRKQLRDIPTQHIRRVLPLLIVQDHSLGGLMVNTWINRRFKELLDLQPIAKDVEVLPLNLINIEDLETLVESYEGSELDFLRVLESKAVKDPNMTSELQYFLSGVDGYRFPQSKRATEIHDQFQQAMISSLFPNAQTSQTAQSSSTSSDSKGH
jgi:hypothetical protein